MSNDTLGVGIQGAGWWGEQHIGAYQKNPHTRVAAICGRDRAKLEAKADALKLSCRVYTDYEQMLADEEVAIVSVCTTSHRHAQDTIMAADAGRHIFIEKPVATTLEDLARVRDAVCGAGIRTVVGFVVRWNPMFKTIKALVDDGAIGEIFMAQADFWQNVAAMDIPMNRWLPKKEFAGSSMLAGGSHAVDAMRWLVGSEVNQVSAYSVNGRSPDYDHDPTIIALLQFANGAVAKVASTLEAKAPYLMRIELLGKEGTIRNNELYSHKLPGQTDYAVIPTAVPGGGERDDSLQGEIDHFVDCIMNGRESDVNLADGVKTHEVCMAADISALEGRPVKLPLI